MSICPLSSDFWTILCMLDIDSELAIIRLLASHTIRTMSTANLQYAEHADELTSDSICHTSSVL